jgi:hypothetical protein
LKEKIGFSGGLIATIIIIVFGVYLYKHNVHQNVVTWILWAIMDMIILLSSIAAGNKRPWLPAGYTLGSILIIALILLRGEWQFGLVETLSSCGVIVTVIVWKRSGPKLAVIASTLGLTIAGIPGMYDAWLQPNRESWWLWGGVAFSCIFSCYGAKAWTIEDRFLPCASFIFNITMMILVLR